MRKSSWIIPYIKENRGLFLLVIFLGTLTFASAGALMFTSGHLISKSSLMPESIMAVYISTVGVRAFGIMRSVSRYVERLSSHSLVLRILEKMRVRLYRLLEPQALLLKSRYKTGDILGLLAGDIEHLQNFYLTTMLPAIVSLVLYAGVVIALGAFSIPFAALFVLLIGLLVLVLPWVSLLYARGKNAYLKQGRNSLYQKFTDAVFGISDWKFSGREKTFISNYEKDEADMLRTENKQFHFVNWRDFFSQLVVGFMVIVMVYWSTAESRDGAFSGTMIAAFVLAIMALAEAFVPVSSAISDKSLYQDSLARLDKIEDPTLPTFEEETKEIERINTEKVVLKAENLTFAYDKKSPEILNGFDFTLQQGEKVAIIGRSGTGKSTFLKLVQGALLPTAGKVTMNGVEVENLRPQIPELTSMLNQKAHLFSTTVLNNIRLGNQDATDEEVYEAAKKVQLHDFIMSMPDGYHTQMSEMGERFSGGERGRIALARILLQNTPIVILDEPTVGLDPITERDLLATIFETLADKSLIWVTHHLVGAEKMDRVLFLEEGKTLMEGPHVALMAEEPRYKRLYQLDRPIEL
ncbi:thiol reductant ABC exporter subunit CydC [Listeria marthii]|uniref:Thiol reductant ABC exporter subunit CydC n=1 Tax=Listeria marthii TaxID=529731 RepID=A0A842CHP4_9LIST|nr:thiol reductant ABC exporter subunit CydC [Listeria marthii]MBC1978566.1 thiol reductant ABC exporter subunit CydC [Listeria marthii]